MFLCRAWRQAMQPGATHRESSAEIAATKKLLQRCGVRAETFERLQAELDCLDAKSVRRCRHCPGGLTVDLPPAGADEERDTLYVDCNEAIEQRVVGICEGRPGCMMPALLTTI